MADLLSTSVSGLLAFEQALQTTSHNISNVDTPGYSRETAELAARLPQAFSSGWVGSGVEVSTITRSYDDLLAQQVNTSQSSYSNFSAYAAQASQVTNLLSDSTTGITATFQKFVNALQDVANSPASTAQRQVLLSQAQGLATQLASYNSTLSQYDSNVDSQVVNSVGEINTLASGIAQLNSKIASAYAGTGQPPNDLLDQRNQMLNQLSQYVSVNTAMQSDGQMNVFVGNGQGLVVGSTSQQLSTVPDSFNPTRHDIVVSTPSGQSDVTSQLSGGSIGGLLAFRSEMLDPTINALGRVSVGLAAVVNGQQQAGMDLTGAMGQDMFSVGGVQTLANASNTGTATLAVTRTDINALTNDNYQLEKTATGWQLQDTTTQQVVPTTGTGTAADPLKADGISIVVSGTAATADRFLVQPTAGATAGLSVLLTNPSQIAAAAPVRTAAAAANTGTAAISSAVVTDPANTQLRAAATITFVTPTTYTVNGALPALNYTSGAAIDANGWQVNITGTPKAGDSFTVSDNAGGTGDNSNALAMAAALANPLFDGGTTSLSASTTNLVSQVGAATQQVQANAAAQKAVNQDAVSSLSNVSGVNLDEEAANLLRYQQAYQAAAQLIQASSTMFNSLLNATNQA